MSQLVHKYFKKSFDGLLILVQLDPCLSTIDYLLSTMCCMER